MGDYSLRFLLNELQLPLDALPLQTKLIMGPQHNSDLSQFVRKVRDYLGVLMQIGGLVVDVDISHHPFRRTSQSLISCSRDT
jgi:hypothetical protein